MQRVYRGLFLGLVVFLAGMVFYIVQHRVLPTYAPAQAGLLEVHFIDVGQGDSIFIRTPDGKTALIDGGPGRSGVLAYLQAHGVTALDVVVATHPHEDHIGGLIAVMDSLPVGGIWTSGASHTTLTYERFLDVIAARRIPYHEVQTAGEIALGDMTFEVLYGATNAKKLNNTSLVLRLEYGHTSFLFTGDAEVSIEKILLNTSSALLPSTVLKIGHHGSSTSSSRAFIEAVHPQIAIYSAGKGNRYGHPDSTTLKTFASLSIPVYGTAKMGSIVVTTDGDQVNAYSDSGPIITTFGILAPKDGQRLPYTARAAVSPQGMP